MTEFMPASGTSRRCLLAIFVLLAALAIPATARAQTATTQTASVSVSDSGFWPPSVTIPTGGSVSWTNQGSITHTAESVGGPSNFNTAGIGPGQSASMAFAAPGIYAYTSGADCLHGVFNGKFACGDYTIVVLAENGSLPAAVSPTPNPAPPTQSKPVASGTVNITDAGFVPATIAVGLSGTVTWMNNGASVHTATTTQDTLTANLPAFDSGGLAPGQSTTITFNTPGTYVYFSAPDCFSKSNPSGFTCGYYTVIVSNAPAVPAQPVTGPTATPIVVPGANLNVTVDDVNGFTPNVLTIKAGQTVAWANIGQNAHSVVINQNPQPSQPAPWWLPYKLPTVNGFFFDSGGLSPQQTFTYQFTTPGTYPYHSSTEPLYLANQINCSCTFVTYKFFGSVVVTP